MEKNVIMLLRELLSPEVREHLYLETQGAFAYPLETGGIRIISSTQGPTQVQRASAKVLGLPMNKVEVDVTRIGGGFGGKEIRIYMEAVIALSQHGN